jgi:hypothetical protein
MTTIELKMKGGGKDSGSIRLCWSRLVWSILRLKRTQFHSRKACYAKPDKNTGNLASGQADNGAIPVPSAARGNTHNYWCNLTKWVFHLREAKVGIRAEREPLCLNLL